MQAAKDPPIDSPPEPANETFAVSTLPVASGFDAGGLPGGSGSRTTDMVVAVGTGVSPKDHVAVQARDACTEDNPEKPPRTTRPRSSLWQMVQSKPRIYHCIETNPGIPAQAVRVAVTGPLLFVASCELGSIKPMKTQMKISRFGVLFPKNRACWGNE